MNYGDVATHLARLYAEDFGGKHSGRYRISSKLLRDLMGRRRLHPEDYAGIARALLEEGFVFIDMESFFVVMSANSFVNYRRAGKDQLS